MKRKIRNVGRIIVCFCFLMTSTSCDHHEKNAALKIEQKKTGDDFFDAFKNRSNEPINSVVCDRVSTEIFKRARLIQETEGRAITTNDIIQLIGVPDTITDTNTIKYIVKKRGILIKNETWGKGEERTLVFYLSTNGIARCGWSCSI